MRRRGAFQAPTIAIGRQREDLIDGPSAIQPTLESRETQPGALRPFHQGQRLCVPRYEAIRATVRGLLKRCGPSAVLWRVIAVVVDAIKREAVWPLAHVRQEGAEVVQPAFAHPNAAPAVGVPAFRFRIRAALLRRFPDRVFRQIDLPVARHTFKPEAAAASCIASLERVNADDGCFPAIAFAQPSSVPPCMTVEGDSDKTPEARAGQINRIHASDYIPASGVADRAERKLTNVSFHKERVYGLQTECNECHWGVFVRC